MRRRPRRRGSGIPRLEVDGEHLLLALLDQPDGLVPRLLAEAGSHAERLRGQVEAGLRRRPG